jgi:hypothetical protein
LQQVEKMVRLVSEWIKLTNRERRRYGEELEGIQG